MKPVVEGYNLLVLLGATATGKTALAVRVAQHLRAEIISADSRQVYRGMDLGTGKDLAEYGRIPYHLIDIIEPGSEYNLFSFQRDCFACLEKIWQRKTLPILCGGTGMYLDAVLRGYQLLEVAENPVLREELIQLTDEQLRFRLQQLKPRQHNRTDLEDRERLIRAIEIALAERDSGPPPGAGPKLKPVIFGLRWPREILRQRIALRLQQRFDAGMVDEVQELNAHGVPWEKLEFYGLEYRLIAQYLQGHLSLNDMRQKLRSAIGQFAKRQETFFRRMEKQGLNIQWLDGQGDAYSKLGELLAHQTYRPPA
jgi:tRNA dimethylallyltransferase